MGIETMGTIIARLRKEKGATQDDLATCVGVSPQAVSKWENGGMPDAELLPKIADFLDTSIDTLFGRSIKDKGNVAQMLANQLAGKSPDVKLQTIFELCWEMEKALFSPDFNTSKDSLKYHQQSMGKEEQMYSSVLWDAGYTRMGIASRLQYFLIVPEPEDKELAFFNGIDYNTFFKDLADKNVFDTMVMLNKRENGKAFTISLLVSHLGIDADTAINIIKTLHKYSLIETTLIEVDDIVQEVYMFKPTPSFTAMLIFAREMIDRPNCFSYYMGGRSKPYL